MKTLIITAHPSPRNFTQAIAEAWVQAGGGEVIDLYDPRYRLEFLQFESADQLPTDPTIKLLQDKIRATERLVIVHPVWWGMPPAIMKNFCDVVLAAKFAFKFRSGHLRPRGLLAGREAYVFMTGDSPTWVHRWLFGISKRFWAQRMVGILPICGVRVRHIEVFGGMRKSSLDQRNRWLVKVARLASK